MSEDPCHPVGFESDIMICKKIYKYSKQGWA